MYQGSFVVFDRQNGLCALYILLDYNGLEYSYEICNQRFKLFRFMYLHLLDKSTMSACCPATQPTLGILVPKWDIISRQQDV